MHPKPPKTNSQSTTLIDPSHKISKTLNTPKIKFQFQDGCNFFPMGKAKKNLILNSIQVKQQET